MKQELEYFDSLAGRWSEKYQASRLFQQRRALILSLLDRWQAKGGTALDYGCGAGVLTKDLADRFQSVVAVDRSEAMRAAARSATAGLSNVTVLAPEELQGKNFDLILCSSVIEYVNEDTEFLRELGDLLAPGGRLLITFPNRWGPLQMFNRSMVQYVRADCYARYQAHVYTDKRINNMAAKAGLRCEAVVHGVGLWPFKLAGLSEQIFVVMGRR